MPLVSGLPSSIPQRLGAWDPEPHRLPELPQGRWKKLHEMRKGWWVTACLRTGEVAFRSPFGGGGVHSHADGGASAKLTWLMESSKTHRDSPSTTSISSPAGTLEAGTGQGHTLPGQVQHAHRGRAHTRLAGEVRHEPCFSHQAEASGQMPQRCQGQEMVWEAESRGASWYCVCFS